MMARRQANDKPSPEPVIVVCWHMYFTWPLQWRHNERDGVSDRRLLGCLLSCLFRRRSKKTSMSLAFVRGIHRWPVDSPHKGPVTRKIIPFDDIVMASMGQYHSPSSLQYKSHFSRQLICWSLRCSWSIACRRCSNYIFILNWTPGFNGLGKDNYNMRREAFKFWYLVRLILETLR